MINSINLLCAINFPNVKSFPVLCAENQVEIPRITFRKPVYMVGDWLEVNCTSGTATPTPHITWLLNGKKVIDVRTHFVFRINS